jgi:uncharacterized OB-fold protein
MALVIQPVLYIDVQGEIPAAYCEECGGALYRPGLVCIRCQREQP